MFNLHLSRWRGVAWVGGSRVEFESRGKSNAVDAAGDVDVSDN